MSHRSSGIHSYHPAPDHVDGPALLLGPAHLDRRYSSPSPSTPHWTTLQVTRYAMGPMPARSKMLPGAPHFISSALEGGRMAALAGPALPSPRGGEMAKMAAGDGMHTLTLSRH